MIGDLALRFFLGGLIVSLFAVVGEVFKPKSFAGLFGAAPSVAIATLALAYAKQGPDYVATEARSMLLASFAFAAYSAACAALIRRVAMPAWLGATLAWSVWGAVAFAALWGLRLVGSSA
ncbi:MAG TPA: hypothetical protein VFD92_02150 [Candidatus Binatia bacterium]|nr:hypothetical protein [Candidatus Binatia bacterium]